MLPTLLALSMTLGGAVEPATSPAIPTPATPTVHELRREAADVLRSSLDGLSEQPELRRVPVLLEAGTASAELLRQSVLGAELRKIVSDARWREASQPGSALAPLENELRDALSDLAFEPILEAALPEGFPAPTPVGEIEVKQYPTYRMARTGSSGNGAFWQLFQHIQRNDIPMTAPVEMTYDATGDEVDMAFMYEHAAQGSLGEDGSVEVVDIEPMLVASIGCRGWSTEATVTKAYVELATWILDRDDMQIAGPTRQFGYNGPSVRGDKRYFEVQIPVRRLTNDLNEK